MYERFFNLSSDPFRLSPDHRFCYQHPQYTKAKAYMAYAFRRAEGFVMVTGPPGTGKTTLIGDLVEYLSGENIVVANLVTTQLGADDLLRMVGSTFDINTQDTDKSTILQQLTTRFLALDKKGGRALLIVDEAQDLSTSAMEELRLLTNLQHQGKPLLQIFLLGQPELRELVRDKGLEPLHQRIIAASHLTALKEEQTRAYIEHRLHVVGWKNDPEISAAVFPIVYQFSEGIPRRINLMCNRLLLHCFVEQRHRISVSDARTVIEELQDEQLSPRGPLNGSLFQAKDVFECTMTTEPENQTDAPVSGTKALFQVKEVSTPVFADKIEPTAQTTVDSDDATEYKGPDRRKENRRSGTDRREDIRFEIGKEDRRKNHGRRHDDNSPEFW